jgi:hypothetical protein
MNPTALSRVRVGGFTRFAWQAGNLPVGAVVCLAGEVVV